MKSRRLMTSHDLECPACQSLAYVVNLLVDDAGCLHGSLSVVDSDSYGHMAVVQVDGEDMEAMGHALQGGIEAAYLRAHSEEGS